LCPVNFQFIHVASKNVTVRECPSSKMVSLSGEQGQGVSRKIFCV